MMDFGQTSPVSNQFGIRASTHQLRVLEEQDEGQGCGGYNELEIILLSEGLVGPGYTLRGWGEGMNMVYFIADGETKLR